MSTKTTPTPTPQSRKDDETRLVETKELIRTQKETILRLEGEIKILTALRSEQELKIEQITEERGILKNNIKELTYEKNDMATKYNRLVEEYKNMETNRQEPKTSTEEEEDQPNEKKVKKISNNEKGNPKPIAMSEFTDIIELFLNEGAPTAISRIEWLFSLYNVYDANSRIHYLITGVFNKPQEKRETLLKVANALADYLDIGENITWERVVEIINSCDDSEKRRTEAWKGFLNIRDKGVDDHGSNYEAYLLRWNKAKAYWSTALTRNERFNFLLSGLPATVTLEVLNKRGNLTEVQFNETPQETWINWINSAVRTLKEAKRIKDDMLRNSLTNLNISQNYNNNQNNKIKNYNNSNLNNNSIIQNNNNINNQASSSNGNKPSNQNSQRQHQKPIECYACHKTGHKYSECPNRGNRS
ncbi:hypothetical protein ACTFIU_011425 [Dictyostelium citrinum]